MSNAEPEREPADSDPRWKLSPTKIVVAVILLLAIILPLLVGSYASVEPRLFGFPFFYWYQLAWVFLAAACCAVCYALLRAERGRFENNRDAAGAAAHADDTDDTAGGRR